MNILILGNGAREHSIAWAVKQNPKCSRLLVAPGNAGIADIADISTINIENCDEVVKLATQEKIDFVIIGPEAPLAAGVSDELKNKGFLVFGPTKAAAQLEISKILFYLRSQFVKMTKTNSHLKDWNLLHISQP